jgi:alpha-D-xyloside xylohydrolase
VRVESIIPFGSFILSAQQRQDIASLRVYPGADASSVLFSDDGNTYASEKGASSITMPHWDAATNQLKHEGAAAWSAPDKAIVEVVGR